MTNPIQYKLTASTIPISLVGEKETIEMELVELKADVREAYLDSVTKRLRLNGEGKPMGLSKHQGMHADLLTLCLKRKDNQPVTAAFIQDLPSSVAADLMKQAQKLNRLGGEEEKEPPQKNA